MPITTITKNFGNALKSLLPIVCGVPDSVFSGISDRYKIEIHAHEGGSLGGLGKGKQIFRINAYLQDKISLTGGNTWGSIAQDIPYYQKVIDKVDAAAQGIFGRTAKTAMSTQRKWTGSSPIGINLKLKFEAVNKVNEEVLLPCKLLQSLTLPYSGIKGFGLLPPGPNPYTLEQTEESSRGENVTINVGNFIRFTSVIVTNVKVTYENRMSDDGPIGAEVDLSIETWRMLTRDELDTAYDNDIKITQSRDLQGVRPLEGPVQANGNL